jgi:glycosyltransferase involved in cell wall biosynthesis
MANGPLRIIAVGRMIRWKGQRYLLEGLASFLKNYPGKATLTLIGEGDEREPLENLCRNLGLGNAVNFRGAVKHAEVAQALQKHDLLIQPSIVDPETRQCESFGMTILEAIASGLPVAVSRSGGMPELVGSESSWSRIFKPASAQAIADVIEACYIKKPHLSSNADYAKERLNFFSWENQEASLTDAYRSVMTT